MRNLIHIFLWGEEIGALEWKPSTGRSGTITSLGIPNVPADMLKQLVEERIL